MNPSGDGVLGRRGYSEGECHFMTEESHNREAIKISRHTEEQHLQSAECWLKTQAVCKTFQPNVGTFTANVVIGKRSIPFHFVNNAILRGLNNCSPQNDCKSCEVYKTSRKVASTFAEGATHVALSNNLRKVAFTLAEVLITLGIIGVVAALTLPSVVKHYKAKVLEVAFKKSVSNLYQAYDMTRRELGVENVYQTYVYLLWLMVDMATLQPNLETLLKRT